MSESTMAAESRILDGTRPINREALADLAFERARLGARWLASVVRDNGKFYYSYNPESDRYRISKYNRIRHAGCTYALFQVYEAFGDEKVLAAAERAAQFIKRKSRLVEDRKRAFVFKKVTKLGLQSLALVALLERRRVTHDAAHDPRIRRLARLLLSLEMADEPGRYYQSYHLESGTRRLTPLSDYYPGEALLALTRLAVQFPQGPYLDYAERAAEYLVHQRDGDLPSLGEVPREDHWLTMALAELYRLRPDPAYAQVVYLQARSILQHQYTAEDGHPEWIGGSCLRDPINYTSTATKAEALTAAWSLAASRGDRDMAEETAEATRRTVQYLMRAQYTAENTGRFRRPERLIGAWGQDAVKPYARIDFVQHNVSALIGVYYMTRDGDLPLAPGVGRSS